jgi:hypothetical protein
MRNVGSRESSFAPPTTSSTGASVKCAKETAGNLHFKPIVYVIDIYSNIGNTSTWCRSRGAWLDSDFPAARKYVHLFMTQFAALTTKPTPTNAFWILKTADPDHWCPNNTEANVESLRRAQARIICFDETTKL